MRQTNLYLGGSLDGVAAFDIGSKMDSVARVGGIYAMIGLTTRALVGLFRCITVTPDITYELVGRADFWQADLAQFDGVIRWENQGAATHSWGVAGDRATGGIINNGDGAQFLRGLVPLAGVERAVRGVARLDSLAMVSGNGAWIGTSRSAAPTLFSGGGLGVNATPAYVCGAFVAQSLTAPTQTSNAAFVGAPSTSADQVVAMQAAAYGTGMVGEILRAGIHESNGQQQLNSTATGTNSGSVNDRIVCISGRGIVWRLLSLEITGQVTS